jgi:hypothetical protein
MMASEKEAAQEGQYSRRVVVPQNVVIVHFIHLLLSYSPAAAPVFYSFLCILSYFFIAHKTITV